MTPSTSDAPPGRRLADVPTSGPAAARPIAGPPVGVRERRDRAMGWRSRDVARGVVVALAIYYFAQLFWFANALVFVVFLGVLFGLAVSTAVDRAERLGIRRGIASALIVFGTLGALVGIGALMAPTLTSQFTVLRQQIPTALNRAETWIRTHPRSLVATAAQGLLGTGAASTPAAPLAARRRAGAPAPAPAGTAPGGATGAGSATDSAPGGAGTPGRTTTDTANGATADTVLGAVPRAVAPPGDTGAARAATAAGDTAAADTGVATTGAGGAAAADAARADSSDARTARVAAQAAAQAASQAASQTAARTSAQTAQAVQAIQAAQARSDSAAAVTPGTAPAPSAVQGLSTRLGGQLARATGFLFSFLSSLGTVAAGLVLIIFLAIYIGAEPKLYHNGLMHLFPHRSRDKAGEVLTKMATVLRKWLTTQLIAMAVIGSVTAAAMFALNVKAALALGFIAGILEFVPTVGPILSAIPAIAVGFADGPEKALAVVAAYWGIQFLENNLLIPWLMRGGMDLPPALTLVAQALMTFVFGFLGLMVAVPLTAAMLVPIKVLWVRDTIGDDIEVDDDGDDDSDDSGGGRDAEKLGAVGPRKG